MVDEEEEVELGRYYTAAELNSMAMPVSEGAQRRNVVLWLKAGESVDRLATTKGGRIWGPVVVEVLYYEDGGAEQRLWDPNDPGAPAPVVREPKKRTARRRYPRR